MKAMLLPLIVLCTVIISGCATVDRKISLNYSQLDRPFGRHNGTVVVAISPSKKLLKNEQGATIVGALNNANGVRKAAILADKTVEEWIAEAMLRELQVLGYSASIRQQLPADIQHGISISSPTITLDVNKGVVSDDTRHQLTFTADLYARGSKVKTVTIASRDSRIVPFSASTTELEKIMLSALQEAMIQIIPEIIALTGSK